MFRVWFAVRALGCAWFLLNEGTRIVSAEFLKLVAVERSPNLTLGLRSVVLSPS